MKLSELQRNDWLTNTNTTEFWADITVMEHSNVDSQYISNHRDLVRKSTSLFLEPSGS